jgi:hypothetical protein
VDTIDVHVRRRQIELARSIRHRKKLYLDLRFWIIARDAALDATDDPNAKKLLHFLRRGVGGERLVCPISDSTFLEVMKQANTPTRRQATAQLVDELSLGVSCTTSATRTATEVAYFVHSLTGKADLDEMQELVWTKLSYALGYLHPSIKDLDPKTQLQLQQDVFDEIWDRRFAEIVERIGDNTPPGPDPYVASASTIDADIKAHREKLVSYEQTYRDEIVGAADACSGFFMDVIASEAEKVGVTPEPKGTPAWNEHARVSRNLLVAAFEKPDTNKVLRSMHVQASLHAGLRWNKNTKFVANHLYDFEHASVALSYCDAFFTEGFLANLVNAKHIRLHELNGCRTTSDVGEAVEILRSLIAA